MKRYFQLHLFTHFVFFYNYNVWRAKFMARKSWWYFETISLQPASSDSMKGFLTKKTAWKDISKLLNCDMENAHAEQFGTFVFAIFFLLDAAWVPWRSRGSPFSQRSRHFIPAMADWLVTSLRWCRLCARSKTQFHTQTSAQSCLFPNWNKNTPN